MVIEQGEGGEIEHPYERETFKRLIDPGGVTPQGSGSQTHTSLPKSLS